MKKINKNKIKLCYEMNRVFSRDSIKQFDFHWLLNITFLHGEIPILPGLLWSSITLFSFNISLALALQHFPVNPPYIYISFFTTVQKHNCAHLGSICHSICSRSHDLRRWGCQQALCWSPAKSCIFSPAEHKAGAQSKESHHYCRHPP